MPFINLPDGSGKLYVPEKKALPGRRDVCPDCFDCQECSSDRCEKCRKCRSCRKADNTMTQQTLATPPQTTIMNEKRSLLNVKLLRQVLIAADDIMHFAVAAVLMVCAAIILVRTIPNLFHGETTALLHVLNDVLLALIVMELMWPIVRFLKRKPFSLNPFLYIGIISSTRRILLIEAEHSMLASLSGKIFKWEETWPALAELGVNVGIILVLAIALKLVATREEEGAS